MLHEFIDGWHYFWAGYTFSMMFMVGMTAGIIVLDTVATSLVRIWKGLRDSSTSLI